jgi:superfamily II helicase
MAMPVLQYVGQLIAQACTNEEIVATLHREGYCMSPDDATALLKNFYDNWKNLDKTLDLSEDDYHRWHAHLRLQLLKRCIADPSTPSTACALRILDSMAAMQGLLKKEEFKNILPLKIEFVPAGSVPQVEDTDTDDNDNIDNDEV